MFAKNEDEEEVVTSDGVDGAEEPGKEMLDRKSCSFSV